MNIFVPLIIIITIFLIGVNLEDSFVRSSMSGIVSSLVFYAIMKLEGVKLNK